MVRPDSALPAAVIVSWVLLSMLRRKTPLRSLLALALPFTLIVGGWTTWRVWYYKSWLPNTFYAKTGWTQAMLENGLLFVGRFMHWYLLWPVLVTGPVLLAARWRKIELDDRPAGLVLLALILFSWLAYVVAIGGDFMEFRLLVPITPPLFLLLSYLVVYPIGAALGQRQVLAAILALLVLVSMSTRHGRSFRSLTPDKSLDSVDALAHFYGLYPDRNWSAVGAPLRDKLGDSNPILALHAVGAIPFYSGYRTVDQLGLTDRYVAEQGNRAPATYRRPGHQRHASVRYLRERGVNFVIGNPTLVPLDVLDRRNARNLLEQWLSNAVEFDPEPVSNATFVVLPLRPGVGLLLWYLTPTPSLDALIAANHWALRSFAR